MKRASESDRAMPAAGVPRTLCAATVLRLLVAATALGAAAFSSSDGLISAARAQSTPSASSAEHSAADQMLDSLISVLHTNGFTAKRIETPTPFTGGIETHLTGVADVKVQLMVLPCKEGATSICYLGFLTVFPRAPVFTPETMSRLDLLTMAHVFQHSDDRGSNVLLLEYTYACRDIRDPKFVMMVLRYFTAAVRQVSHTLQELGGAGTVPGLPAKPDEPAR